MSGDESKAGQKPFRVRIVRGEPYHVGGRTLIPVARVVSFGKAKGSVGTDRIGGWGLGGSWVTPVAFVEKTADGERRIPLHDATGDALRKMLGAAVALSLGFAATRWLARRRRER